MDHLSPFQYSSYSLGGVWLSILNPDHEARLLRKNTILSSILPGPKEASQMEMTRLLKPLIDELKVLQDGVVMQDFDGRERVVIACLVLISADLPAIRKLMGVAAHNGTCSCLFCNVQFASLDNNQRDYSNTDIDSYPRRTKQTHAKNSADWMRAKTQGERDEHKKSTGTSSFSVFQELSYFDCVKFQTVDILHCSY